jgi:hypothetical protein
MKRRVNNNNLCDVHIYICVSVVIIYECASVKRPVVKGGCMCET